MTEQHLFRFEHKNQPILSRWAFAKRLVKSIIFTSGVIGLSLFGGMAGYHIFEGMPWIDAFANAAMILSGMGPLAPLQTWNGKLFAGVYALYSGLVLVLAIGVIIAPIVHRIFHKFHLEMDEKGQKKPSK